jgi:hypothetical protein
MANGPIFSLQEVRSLLAAMMGLSISAAAIRSAAEMAGRVEAELSKPRFS